MTPLPALTDLRRHDSNPGGGKDLGRLPVWDLTDLYPAPDAPEVARGVVAGPQGWALAMDPRVYAAVGPAIPDLLAACRAPLHLAAGADDPMASPDTMRRLDPRAILLPGLPHNAHVADAAAVAALIG